MHLFSSEDTNQVLLQFTNREQRNKFQYQSALISMLKAKRFSHGRVKVIKVDPKEKENQCFPDEFHLKKAGHYPPKHVEDYLLHPKSIIHEEISVFLDQPHCKSLALDKHSNLQELRSFQNGFLSSPFSPIPRNWKGETQQLRAEPIPGILNCDEPANSQDSFCSEQEIGSETFRCYLKRQLQGLKKQYEKLLSRKEELSEIRTARMEEKLSILQTLQEIHTKQARELLKMY